MTTEMKEEIQKFVNELGNDTPRTAKKAITEILTKMYAEGKSPLEAFGITPEIEEYLYNQGYKLFQSGKFKKALGIFYFLRRLDINSARYAFALAATHHYLHEYIQAIDHYTVCNLLDTENPVPYFHLYDCYLKLNAPILAWKSLEAVIILTEKDPAYNMLKERAIMERNEIAKKVKKSLNIPVEE